MDKLRHKFSTALQMPLNNWITFIQAWFLLLLVDLALRTVSYPRLLSILNIQVEHPLSAYQWKEIRRVRALVSLAARYHLYEMTCLRRSLVLQKLLSERGIRTNLRFGVRKEADTLAAHAWLEYNGQPISKSEYISSTYATLINKADDERRVF